MKPARLRRSPFVFRGVAAITRVALWASPLLLIGFASAADRVPARVAVNAPSAVGKRAAGIRQLAESKNWSEAVPSLLDLVDASGEELIEVEPGRYIPVVDWASAVVATWPEDGRKQYQIRVEPRARLLLDSSNGAHDETAREAVSRRFPHSAAGISARLQLADHHWKSGQVDEARRLWTGLLIEPSGGSRSVSEADLAARLILCSIVERDFPRARDELAYFEQRFGDVEGAIGSQSGPLRTLLAAVLETAAQNSADHESRNSSSARAGRVVWRSELPGPPLELPPGESRSPPRPDVRPIVDRDHLFLVTETDVRALRLDTGEALWPTKKQPDPEIFYRSANPRFIGTLPSAGIARFGGAVAGDRLFALLGPPVAGGDEESLDLLRPRLMAFEIGRGEGRVAWIQDANGALAHQEWTPVGPPVAEGTSLWVPVQRNLPKGELAVAHLRAANGDVAWITPLGTPLLAETRDRMVWDSNWLLRHGGDVILQTNAGALAAVDARRGRMKWIITLPVLPLSNDDLNRPLRNRTSAPVVWRGRLIAAPRGADAVFGCDAGTGEILWRRELPERGLQVAGVAGSTLIASGKSLWGIEAATGRVLWRVGFEDEDGSGAGQAAIVGDTVYWCTFTDLIAVDARSGELRQRDPLRERDSLRGGSVYAAGNRLLVVTADEIAAIELEPSTSPAVGPHAGIGP